MDRRKLPTHGYRGVHVIITFDNHLLEIQVRSLLQDLWAQAMERFLTAWFGPNAPGRDRGRPGEKSIDYGAIDMKDGGTAIPYNAEDPFLRKEFEETLASVGAKSRMEQELYERSY